VAVKSGDTQHLVLVLLLMHKILCSLAAGKGQFCG